MMMDDDQDRILDEHMSVVRQQAFLMKKALDSNNLREALKFSSTMLCELKTSLLSPRNYFQLYMMTFDELAYLENHFIEEQKRGRKMSDLYESVQHAGNIIPRLYLLITVGSAYIKTKEAPVKLILRDLLDMVKGVQQPIRGLFLRYYLLKMMKDKLPDVGSEFEGPENGDVTDAIDFILQNMSEMNRLWVRLQHLSSQKDKDMREVERNELRVTVGENIIRLSSLEGLTFEIYKATVLPKILEIIVICKDTLAQQYLMECVIQAFPDEYHLQSLEQLLETTASLNSNVDIKSIFINLMEKLSRFANNGGSGEEESPEGNEAAKLAGDLDIFKLFKKYTDKIIEEQGKTIDVSRLLELEVAFMNFCIKTYPNNLDYVNQILESCNSILKSTPINNNDKNCMKLLVKLLTIPLDSLSIAVLSMNHYPGLMQYMKFQNKRTVALKIVKSVIKDNKPLESAQTVDQLIEFIMPLLQDDKDAGAKEDPYEFEEGQNSISKLVQLVVNPGNDLWYSLILKLKKVFLKGGQNRMSYTMPALIFALFKLSAQIESGVGGGDAVADDTGEQLVKVDQLKVFKVVNELVLALQEHKPELCMKLYLQACLAINRVQNYAVIEELAYEFCSQALLIYQEEISDSDAKQQAINLICTTLYNLNCFSEENHHTLLANAISSCAQLLKKPAQCEAIIGASSLYNSQFKVDGKKVMDQLKKALKICDVCMSSAKNLYLCVDLLNKYLYFYIYEATFMTHEDINNLLDFIKEHVDGLEDKDAAKDGLKYLENTKKAIRFKAETNERLKLIKID